MYARSIVVALTAAVIAAPTFTNAQFSSSCPASLPVTMSMTSELSSTVASASVGFHVLMMNQSAELIYNMTLAVDVVEKSTGAIVDRFFVPQRVTLLQQSSGKADFVWKTSGGLASGEYAVKATLVPEGTPLSSIFSGALSPSATVDITIKKGDRPSASISTITVNGTEYHPHTIVRVAEGTAQVVVASGNSEGAPYKGTLTWRLYAPDATSTDAVLDARIEAVKLHPDASTDIRYILTDSTRDGYYLEGQLSDGRSFRYIDVWLSRTDTVFPWTKCIAGAGGTSNGQNSIVVVVSVIAAILALGAIWEFAKRRRA